MMKVLKFVGVLSIICICNAINIVEVRKMKLTECPFKDKNEFSIGKATKSKLRIEKGGLKYKALINDTKIKIHNGALSLLLANDPTNTVEKIEQVLTVDNEISKNASGTVESISIKPFQISKCDVDTGLIMSEVSFQIQDVTFIISIDDGNKKEIKAYLEKGCKEYPVVKDVAVWYNSTILKIQANKEKLLMLLQNSISEVYQLSELELSYREKLQGIAFLRKHLNEFNTDMAADGLNIFIHFEFFSRNQSINQILNSQNSLITPKLTQATAVVLTYFNWVSQYIDNPLMYGDKVLGSKFSEWINKC